MSSLHKHFFAFLLLLLPLQAAAVERVTLSVAELEGEGWRLQGLELELTPQEGGRLRLHGAIERLELAAVGETLEALELACPEAILEGGGLSCSHGSLLLGHPWVEREEIALGFAWQQKGGRLTFELGQARIAGGRWTIALEGSPDGGWRLHLSGHGADLARLRKLVAGHVDGLPPTLGGRVDLDLDLVADNEGLHDVVWELRLRKAGFVDAGKLYQGEGVTALLRGALARDEAGMLEGQADLSLSAGALLTPFFYLEPGTRPVRLKTGLVLDTAGRRLKLGALSYHHPGVLELEGRAELDLEPFRLRNLRLETSQVQAGDLYSRYLQPVLAGTLLESVRLDGGFRLTVEQGSKGPLRLELDLHELSLEDAPDPDLYPDLQPRFALRGLSGRVQWSDRGGPWPLALDWHSGQLLGALAFGRAGLRGELRPRGFRLTRSLELPLLDGTLIVDQLELGLPEGETPQLDFDAILTPVSMERLSGAFGWPPLAGSVSGVIPGLSLRRGNITVAGKLLVRIFDGDILIEHLSLSDIFGFLPALSSDVQLKGLDLEALTRTFSFGKITGRLDGRIDGLRLEGWRPVSFAAGFATPAGDDSPHYISQRAVQNISDLGGAGIAGSLSRTFLGLFEEFRYDRLGISCELSGGVCRMGGVEPAEQGYYLVVGSGIPQINIIGFNTRTDWDRLVAQLQQISAGGAPEVQVGP